MFSGKRRKLLKNLFSIKYHSLKSSYLEKSVKKDLKKVRSKTNFFK